MGRVFKSGASRQNQLGSNISRGNQNSDQFITVYLTSSYSDIRQFQQIGTWAWAWGALFNKRKKEKQPSDNISPKRMKMTRRNVV